MTIAAGTYRLGPDTGTLTVRTRKAGAAAKAGHDLLIEVTAWERDARPSASTASIELSADRASLQVRRGHRAA